MVENIITLLIPKGINREIVDSTKAKLDEAGKKYQTIYTDDYKIHSIEAHYNHLSFELPAQINLLI